MFDPVDPAARSRRLAARWLTGWTARVGITAVILTLTPTPGVHAGEPDALAPALVSPPEISVPFPVLLDGDRRATLARQVLEPGPVAEAYAHLQQRAEAALHREPDPIPHLVYEGRVGSDPQRQQTIAHLQDMLGLRALAWTAAIGDDPRYADAARRYVDAWTRTLKPTGNDVNDAKLLPIVTAYHLLADTWPAELRDRVAQWLRDYAEPYLPNLRGDAGRGNRHAKKILMVGLVGLALQRDDLNELASDAVRRFVASSLRPDGTSFDLEERDALSYHVSSLYGPLVWAVNLHAAGSPRGPSLYATPAPDGPYAGASLRRSVHHLYPYVRGERVHAEWVHTRIELDRQRWASGDPYYRPGKPWDPHQADRVLRLAATFDPTARKHLAFLDPSARQLDWLGVLIDAAGH